MAETPAARQKADAIIGALVQPLDVTRVKKRQGGGGRALSYLEGYDVIDRLNEIFGYASWSFEVEDLQEVAVSKGKMFRARVLLTVQIDGTPTRRGDVGVGLAKSENQEEVEKAIKEAATDALKRAARTFGAQFGNELYDKEAPEHQGIQRPDVVTPGQLEAYEALRKRAIAVGVKMKNGGDPQPLAVDTPAERYADIYAKLETIVQKREAAAPLPESLPAETAQHNEVAA